MIDLFIVFNATFSNISAISCRPVLVVEEAEYPKRTTDHGPATETLSLAATSLVHHFLQFTKPIYLSFYHYKSPVNTLPYSWIANFTMFLNCMLSSPLASWYSMVPSLFNISPLSASFALVSLFNNPRAWSSLKYNII